MLKDRLFDYQEVANFANQAIAAVVDRVGPHEHAVVLVTHQLMPHYPLAERSVGRDSNLPAAILAQVDRRSIALTSSEYAATSGRSADKQLAVLEQKGRNARAYGISNTLLVPRSVVMDSGLILTVVSTDKSSDEEAARRDFEIAQEAVRRAAQGQIDQRDLPVEARVVEQAAARLKDQLPPARSGEVIFAYPFTSGDYNLFPDVAVPIASQAVAEVGPGTYRVVEAKVFNSAKKGWPSQEPSAVPGALPVTLRGHEMVIGIGGMPDSNDDLAIIRSLAEGCPALSLAILQRLSSHLYP